jgi:phosphoenolpyruvate synthase/pyruvate phosphate dikinase
VASASSLRTYGVGTALVSGDVNADTFHVSRTGEIVERRIVPKNVAHRQGPDGTSKSRCPTRRPARPAISDRQVLAVAALARTAERQFGRPQDIEWAIEKGHVYLLQSRPITSLPALADPDGALNLWDNSNIAESYNGITTRSRSRSRAASTRKCIDSSAASSACPSSASSSRVTRCVPCSDSYAVASTTIS